MSFWSLDSFKSILGAEWLARPDAIARRYGNGSQAELAGLSTDSRSVKPGQAFIALRGERTDGHRYLAEAAEAGAALLVIDRPEAVPGATLDSLRSRAAILRVADTGAALLRLGGEYRRSLTMTRVVAIAGSNGKTTTTRLVAAVLSRTLRGVASVKSFNNAVGVPLTILSARRTDQFLVCEVGTNAPGEIAQLAEIVRPDVAVITNIGREHLEGLGSMDGVLIEEASLLRSLAPGGLAIVNADSPGLAEAARAALAAGGVRNATFLRFGRSPDAELRLHAVHAGGEGVEFELAGRQSFFTPLLGEHNALNACAAVAVGRRLGVPDAEIAGALRGATGPDMRMQRSVAALPGGEVLLFNDAYNANPESMQAALLAFGSLSRAARRRVVILGDMLELGPAAIELHAEVGRTLAADVRPDLAVLVGPLMAHAAPMVERSLGPRSVALFPDADSPGEVAALLRPGDAVLLKGSRRLALERIAAALSTTTTKPHPAAT